MLSPVFREQLKRSHISNGSGKMPRFNMKYLILFFSVVSCAQYLTDEMAEHLKKWHMQCFDESKVEPEMILRLSKGNWKINNKSLKTWVLCILRKYDLMSNEGVFRLDTAMSLVPDKDRVVVENIIDECLPNKDMAPYDIAWAFAKCYHMKLKSRKYKSKKLHYMTLFY